jgi:transposase
MFAVETYAAVRRSVFVEGKSRREAARVFGLSRETVAKMCRYSVPPGYMRTKDPEKPKLGPSSARGDWTLARRSASSLFRFGDRLNR